MHARFDSAGMAERALKNGLKDQLSANGDRYVKVQGFTSQLLPEETEVAANATTQPTSQPTTQAVMIDKSSTAIGVRSARRSPRIGGSHWPGYC